MPKATPGHYESDRTADLKLQKEHADFNRLMRRKPAAKAPTKPRSIMSRGIAKLQGR